MVTPPPADEVDPHGYGLLLLVLYMVLTVPMFFLIVAVALVAQVRRRAFLVPCLAAGLLFAAVSLGIQTVLAVLVGDLAMLYRGLQAAAIGGVSATIASAFVGLPLVVTRLIEKLASR